jgi:hypothetical protein
VDAVEAGVRKTAPSLRYADGANVERMLIGALTERGARRHERRLTAVPAPVECLSWVHDMVDAGEGDAALLPR